MSTIKVNAVRNTATNDGGIDIDASGHVQIDGVQLPTAGALSNRNLVINGAMQVAQRGTSATGVGNGDTGYNTVDRFRWAEQGAPSCEFTISQSTTAPDGFTNSYRLDTTTAQSSIAAADTIYVDTRLEAQNLQHLAYGTSAAKSITISFYVKSTVTGTYAVWLYNQDGGVACTNTYTISSANTWEYKTFTVAGDTSNSINNDNGIGFFIRFVLCAGTDFTSGTASTTWASASVTDANRFVGHTANIANTTSDDWAITGVQLEVGEVATSFEHRSFGDELARCQRYYIDTRNNKPSHQYIIGQAINSGRIGASVFFTKPMRDTASVTIYSPSNETAGKVAAYNSVGTDIGSGFTGTSPLLNGIHYIFGGSGLTTGSYYSFKYSADAEL